MASVRKEIAVPSSALAVSTEFQRQRSSLYFARDHSRKKPVSQSLEPLVFLKWEFGLGFSLKQIPVRAHYRELGGSLLRADVTKTGNLSVENFSLRWLAVRWGPLAGSNISRFGQTEGEPTALFETNYPSLGLSRTSPSVLGVPLVILLMSQVGRGISFHKKAGGLHWQVRTRQMDRIESKADVTMIASYIRRLHGFHSTRNTGSPRNKSVSFDDHRFVHDGLESFLCVWILRRNRVLQSNCE